jgi:hypothetical protein
MHKYNKLFFSVLIFLAACKEAKTPNGIIQQARMTDLLTEIHIVDGSMYNVMQLPDTLYKYGSNKYLAMFKKYHTDSIQFKKSFKYYSSNPELMQSIYEQITKNIKTKSDSVTKLNNAQVAKDNKRKTDSLNKLPKPTVKPSATTLALPPIMQQRNNPHPKASKRHVDTIK